VSDTVYEGKACHKLTEHEKVVDQIDWDVTETSREQYTYEENGVVFGFTDGLLENIWDTLYNFNAVPGDKWHLFEAALITKSK
jgi:hypothetical protein